MKGTLVKTDQGWVVEHKVAEKTPIGYKSWWGTFPLHPADVKTCIDYGDYSVDWDGKEINFDMVTEWENGEVGVNGLTYAKLIHHPVDTSEVYAVNNYDAWDEVIDQLGDSNKMINHIGEVNEMVNHVPDVGKMVEDVEKLAEEFYPLNDDLYPNSSLIRKAFKAGYNKAKETLYTEEQVGRAIDMARKDWNLKYEIIQSLKQPKQ